MRQLMALCVLAATTALSAPDPCRYAVHRPDAIQRGITQWLPDIGVARLPPELPVFAVPRGRAALLRGSPLPVIVGQMLYEEDVRRGISELTIFDASGGTLFFVSETTFVCPPGGPAGLCREIRAHTEMEPPKGETHPFVITLGPLGGGPRFFRYAVPLDAPTFARELSHSLDWLRRTLTTTTFVVEPERHTLESRAFWALASDPLIAPYLHRLELKTRGRYLVIRGVVPSNHLYGLVIDRARAAGAWYLDPRMIIDTRTRLPPEPALVPQGCWP